MCGTAFAGVGSRRCLARIGTKADFIKAESNAKLFFFFARNCDFKMHPSIMHQLSPPPPPPPGLIFGDAIYFLFVEFWRRLYGSCIRVDIQHVSYFLLQPHRERVGSEALQREWVEQQGRRQRRDVTRVEKGTFAFAIHD